MGQMLFLLENADLGDMEQRDEMILNLDEIKGFTIRSMYRSLYPQEGPSFPTVCMEQTYPLESLIPVVGGVEE